MPGRMGHVFPMFMRSCDRLALEANGTIKPGLGQGEAHWKLMEKHIGESSHSPSSTLKTFGADRFGGSLSSLKRVRVPNGLNGKPSP